MKNRIQKSNSTCGHILKAAMLLFLTIGCGEKEDTLLFQLPPSYSNGAYNVIIETSAGEHLLQSFEIESNTFDTCFQDDLAKRIGFLPLPVNMGFLPSYAGFDSVFQKIQVWMISERMETGSVIAASPLGKLNYIESGQECDAYVMIPNDPLLRTVDASSFEDFTIRFDPVKYAFEYWLRNKNGVGKISRIRWEDESVASAELVDLLNISE